MTDRVITGPEQLSISSLAERSATRQFVRALIEGAPINVILTTPVRDANSYGLGHIQYQQGNTIRWRLDQTENGFTVIGNRV